ncbi:MAG TPA: hypothetical protein PLD20_04695 [Blastocatellia bacterium]|nr:hypothetical protein [Blastocatellia bacterium]HMV81705.1 hypothetical protein [Blastocatellia bacterium]HMX24561.1 hypothetical protein [Blastocatellia bacterium]HMY74219.1 hypothetical protein [Blastocatellia bacterium]HMZ17206.1 hypothetical protein [Blastocatellia bacterium]
MGRIFEHQEVISTPEAKGMRTLPSARGVLVNFSELKAKRELQSPVPRPLPNGCGTSAAAFFKLKSKAFSDPASAYAAEFLQFDPRTDNQAESFQSPHLVKDFAGLDDTNWTPPNSHIAAGPNHLLAAVNATFAVFDKPGRQLLRRTLAEVFSPLVADALIFNPKVLYDQFHGCWLMAACARSMDAQRSWFLLACSQTGDPIGNWWIWALDAGYDGNFKTAYWPEGLGLAVDNSLLYLTANMFTGQDAFAYSKLRILNVKELQSGGILYGWDFWQLRNADGSPAFGVQPAVNLRAAGAQYLLNTNSDGQGVTQWTVSQAMRQAPTLKRRFVPTAPYHLPPDIKQRAGRLEISIGDARLVNVVFRHGLLWAAHTVAANWGDGVNNAAIHWLQINPRAGCATQQGVYGAPHQHYFCPALTVDGEGNLLMVFNQAGENGSPTIRFTGRQTADEPGLLRGSELLLRGLASTSCEWSSFSGAAIAPDDNEVWLMSQYIATESDWPTWIGAVNYTVTEDGANEPYSTQSVYA